MPRGEHGPDSEYIHVQLRPTRLFNRMRTISVGHGVKQVTGRIEGKKEWKPQNVMIPVNKVSKKGDGINVKSKELRDHLHHLGINVTKIKRMKTRGANDYKHPAPACPGSKIRSKGRGQGLGYGRKKGPLGIPKYKKSRKK